MATTIGDPYLLSTYSLPSKSKKGKEKVTTVEEQHAIFASHSRVGKKRDGQVTIAAQGDGIHILDLSDLHPISSHILGPSTSFASPAVTLTIREGEKSFRRTYAAIQRAPDIAEKDECRTICLWKESDEIGGPAERETHVLPHPVSSVLYCEENDSRIFFISRTGQLSQTDRNCNVLNSWTPPHGELKVAKVFAFPRQACSFIQGNNLPPNGTVLLLLLSKKSILQLHTLAFGNDDELVVLDPVCVNDKVSGIADISCTVSGFLSCLCSSGLWYSYRIDISSETKLSSVSLPLSLRNLRFNAVKQDDSLIRTRQVSLLGLKSSYVLVAGIAEGNRPEIALLLCDVQYGVLLHSHMFPIPSTLDNDSLSFTVELVQASSSQALLILAPTSLASKSSQLRTSVLVVPYSVPEMSRLAYALGKAKASAPWLTSDESTMLSTSSSTRDDLAKSQSDILQKVQDAIEEENPEEADRLFFEWVKVNTSPKENKGKAEKKPKKKKAKKIVVEAESNSEFSDGATQNPTEMGNEKKEEISERGSIFNHSIVSRLLELVLHPEIPTTPYSPKIFRFLLQRKLVSNNMIPGHVLPALLSLNDWDSIRECFHKMVDLPEEDVLRTLVVVTRHHRKRSSDSNAMAVDVPTTSQVSNLQSFLAVVIDYPASPVSWRNAIRQHLSDVEDLLSVLTVLDDWVAALTGKGSDIDLSLGEVKSVGKGLYAPIPKTRKVMRLRGTTMPSMENILLFLQAILDSSFLMLLQHPQSHHLLRRLSQNLVPQISFNNGLQPLIGPLAPFAKAQTKALADARSGRKKEEVDWRKRRKAIQEQNAINLGPYQVEEITF